MSNVYHPELKIAFIHVPKCAGTSISRALMDHGFVSAEDNQWYDASYQQLARRVPNIQDYKLVATVRNPVDWCISGYKMCNYWNLTFEEHLKTCINPVWHNRPGYKDWYWHCAILPHVHITSNTNVFKVEQMDKLKSWFEEQLNTVLDIPWVNQKSDTVTVTDSELSLIEKFTNEYAKKYKYKIR